MLANGGGLDALTETGVGFAFVGTTSVGTDLLGALDRSSIVVDASVGYVSANDGIVGPNVYVADASFEASAFY